MAFSINNNNRRRSRRYQSPMSEINVTPFVDVMLVLLIIFMVAAPLLTVGVPVELPKTDAKTLSEDKEPITITIQQDGSVFLQDTKMPLDKIVPKIIAITDDGYEQRIFIRASKNVNYGTVAKIMAKINKAGFNRIALITHRDEQ